MKVLIDSSAFISLLVANQVTFPEAKKVFDKLIEQNTVFYTSNLILSESYTWLLYKNGIRIAKALKEMTESAEKEGYLKIFWIDDLLFKESWPYFVKFSDHKLSFADASSFLLVRKFSLDSIFTFDRSFRKVGLEIKP